MQKHCNCLCRRALSPASIHNRVYNVAWKKTAAQLKVEGKKQRGTYRFELRYLGERNQWVKGPLACSFHTLAHLPLLHAPLGLEGEPRAGGLLGRTPVLGLNPKSVDTSVKLQGGTG